MENTGNQESEIETRLGTITRRYPGRFTDEQVELIRKRIRRSMALAAEMRAHPLTNADGPTFSPIAMNRTDEH